jgi:MtN3 and saliva related transmembrane protein
MNNPAWVGYVGTAAAICTCVSYMPQIIQLFKTKSAKDVSLSMFVVMFASTVLWLVYALAIHSLPVAITNIIVLTFCLIILVLKIKYK